MYDIFLKLVREELTTGKLLSLPDAKISDFQDFIRSSITMLHNTPLESRKFFIEAYKKAIHDADSLLRIRVAKTCLGARHDGETYDSEMLNSIGAIIDFYRDLIIGAYVMPSRDSVVVKFNAGVKINGRNYRAGDIAPLDIRKALGLYILGVVEPIKQPIFNHLL